MVQSYARHGPTQAFGLVCSPSSNSVFDGRLAYVPALEDVLVWDVKKGQMISMWHETGHREEVTFIAQSPQQDSFAVGYADGSIRLWNASTSSVVTTFNGHRKAITALAFNDAGTHFASGSQDTDLILWDIVGEAGLYRLRGHRDQITAIQFLPAPDQPSTSATGVSGFLLTASKDTFMKLWDLSTQHCIQTIVAHRSEIWSLDVSPEKDLVFTGSGEGEVKAWRIDRGAHGLKETETGEVAKSISAISSLPLASKQRISQIKFHPSQPYLAIQSNDRSVEVFRIRTDEEVKKKMARRKKRAKEKKQQNKVETKGSQYLETEPQLENEEVTMDSHFVDYFTPHVVIRASGKVRSFDFGLKETSPKGGSQLFVALANNALEVYNIPQPTKSKDDVLEATKHYSVNLPGHRSDVRTLCLSSDDQILASASNGSLKIWNMKTTQCIRTMECGYAVCSAFLPGDRHVAVGTKSGEIFIYDLASSTLIETIKAHSATIWSMHVRPDRQVLVTGSADKDVKFWEFMHKDSSEVQSGRVLSLVHIKTLKMSDEVLSVKYSPNGKLLAVSLLDSTVKVFYQDSLKFFLSLYGHKLPVLAMDISDDSKLIVTCSADKNVKIWGLDFGDCHKSIFAHDESVMQVAFEKGSHYFWTVGKDKMLKYWDGDKFEGIQKLDGHHGEIWALTLSHYGNFVVTGSQDKSIRVWEKLDEPLFLEEEREKELEKLHESGIADTMNGIHVPAGNGATETEVDVVTKQTTETLMAGERIMEALDLADKERVTFEEYRETMARLSENDALRLQPPPRNPVLAAYDLEPETYVLKVVEKVPSTALQDALLVLPFGKVVSLMVYLDVWVEKDLNITLVARIVFFLLRTHHRQIVANRIMRPTLIRLRKHLRTALQGHKDVIGYNLAALQFIRRKNDSERTALMYEEEGMDEEKVKARIVEGKKRKRVYLKA